MSKRAFHKNKRVDASTDLTLDKLTISDTAIIDNLACDVASIDVLGSEDVEIDDGVLIGPLPYEASFDTHTHSVHIQTESAHGIGNSSIELYSESGTYFGACVDDQKMKYGVLAPQDGGHGQIMHTGDEEVRIGSNNTTKLTINDSAATTDVTANSLAVSKTARKNYGQYESGPTVAWSSGSKWQTNSPLFAVNHGSYILIKGFSSANFSGAWTVECWYRSTTTAQTGTFLSTFCLNRNGGLLFDINYVSSLLIPYVSVNNSSTNIVDQACSSKSGGTNTWFHIGVSYDGTTYRVYDNGTIFSTTSANVISASDLATYGLCIGARMKISTSDAPTFDNQCQCQVSDLRISNTARYTGSTYTVPTAAFVSDANTILINTLGSSDLASHESSPNTSTTASGVTMSTEGNIANESGITVARNGITATNGNIVATNGRVQSYRSFMSDHAGWRIGANAIFTTPTLSTTSATGCYVCTSAGWSVSGSSHTIQAQQFLMNTSHRNIMGTFRIACSDKNGSNGSSAKAGIIQADYFYVQGATTSQVLTISTSRATTSTLTTFTVSNVASSANLLVSTDASCRIAWHFVAFI